MIEDAMKKASAKESVMATMIKDFSAKEVLKI